MSKFTSAQEAFDEYEDKLLQTPDRETFAKFNQSALVVVGFMVARQLERIADVLEKGNKK